MNKPLIVWDWDNTLSDTFEALYDAHVDVCDKYGKRHVTRQEVMSAICGEGAEFWNELFADTNHDERSVYYYDQSAIRLLQKATMFNQAFDILNWLKDNDIDQVVISNQMQWLLDIECQRLGVAPYFKRVVGRVDELKKPHADYLSRALGGLNYDTYIILGDGVSDMKMAQKLDGFGLLVRAHDPKDGMPYDKHVRNLTEALVFLKAYFKK